MLRQAYPLLLAHANGSQPILGRTRFQKMIFLMQEKLAANGAKPAVGLGFVPYDYGPYSKALQQDIDGLIGEGLLESDQIRSPDTGKIMYKYTITGPGEAMADVLMTEPGYREYDFLGAYKTLEGIKEEINGMELGDLLRKVYAEYPEYATYSKYEF